MRSCLFHVCQRPEIYRRLQEEVDRFYEENHLEEPISFLQTQRLPLLQAVVKEATRLLPSIVFQLLRYAPPNFTIRGKYISTGTSIGISPIAQNQDEEIFGADADVFRPERCMEDDARTKYLDSNIMTFGGNGPRMCVGKNIVLVCTAPSIQTLEHLRGELY